MLREAFDTARDLGRLHDIASVLVRFGFADLVRRLGLSGALERAGRMLRWQTAAELSQLSTPARVRRAMEEMGPTFVKLGQLLATRIDLFPAEWISEFEKLQDHTPAVPFERLRDQLTADLGAAPETVFKHLDTTPLAAASIAQVHRAWLADGTPVVLKVRRPGIEPVVDADLRLLARIARLAEAELPDLRRFRPVAVVRQFTLSLRRELDLATECRHAERVAASLAQFDDIVVPRVHWQYTGTRLNVQDFVDGIAGRDLAAVDAAGLHRRILAQRGARAVLKMILEDGFFHADPHPGNLFYLPGDRIAFIDFGMVGRISGARREQVADLLHGLVERDSGRVIDVLLDWAGDAQIDTQSLAIEIDGFIDQYHGASLRQIDLSALIGELTLLLRDHELALPPDLALLIKTLVSLEGMGRQLAPDFDMVSEAAPFLRRAFAERYTPRAVVRRGKRELLDAMSLLTGLPADLRSLARAMRRGAFRIHLDVDDLQKVSERLERALSRLAMSAVIAALIVGSSIVMTVRGGPTLLGLPVFGLIGFAAAGIGGAWLVISIWRSGRYGRK